MDTAEIRAMLSEGQVVRLRDVRKFLLSPCFVPNSSDELIVFVVN